VRGERPTVQYVLFVKSSDFDLRCYDSWVIAELRSVCNCMDLDLSAYQVGCEQLQTLHYIPDFISEPEEQRLLLEVHSKAKWVQVSLPHTHTTQASSRLANKRRRITVLLSLHNSWQQLCLSSQYLNIIVFTATPAVRCIILCHTSQLSGRQLQNHGGSVHSKGLIPAPLPTWLEQLLAQLPQQLLQLFPQDQPPNHVLINSYQAGCGIMVRHFSLHSLT